MYVLDSLCLHYQSGQRFPSEDNSGLHFHDAQFSSHYEILLSGPDTELTSAGRHGASLNAAYAAVQTDDGV